MDDESTTVSERTPHAAAPPRVPAGVPSVVRFSDFEFDFEREQLRRGGRPIRLSPKPAALLRYLLANPQRLLGKAELMERLWGEVVVTDDSLVQCVGELRSRLGEHGPKLITTHPRRGYMFEAEVRPVAPGEPGPAASPAREVLLAAPVAPGTPVSLLPPTASPPARARPGWRRIALAIVLAAVALGAIAAHFLSRPPPYRIDAELARRYSIVITPFLDIGNAPAPRLVLDGLAGEMAAQLTQSQDAIVIRSKAPVGARYAMSGTFAARGAGVAIDVQVTSVADGTVIWAEHYDYPDGNDPNINVDVALRATSGLRLRQAELHRARVSAPGYRFDPADLTVSGWDDIDRRQTEQDVIRAKARFEEALQVDPQSVKALTGLGAALLSERFGHSGEPSPQEVSQSDRIVAQAIGIAPNHPVALINWANVLLLRGEPALALPFYEKAMLSTPSIANTHVRYAYALLIMDRTQEAQHQIDDGLRIGHRDPRVTASAWALAAVLAFTLDDDDKAYALAQRALAERPTFGPSYGTLAAIDALHGRTSAAQKNMAEHLRLMPYSTVTRYIANNPGGAPRYLAGRNRMVEGLRMGGLPE